MLVTDCFLYYRYNFECNAWFDYDTGDTKVDRILIAQPQSKVRSFIEMIAYTAAEHHLWFSVYMRPTRSKFTRVQRMSCLFGMVFLTMFIVTISVVLPENNVYIAQVNIGPFRFTLENANTACIAVAISATIILVVSVFFKNTETDEYNTFHTTFLNAYRRANRTLHFDKSVLGSYFVPPAEEALKYNNCFLPKKCFYAGWFILFMSVIIATYFVFAFSGAWELIESEIWMSTVFMSFFCSILIVEVAKVTLC